MADRCLTAEGENRRGFVCKRRRGHMADQVDAAVNGAEPTVRDPVVDFTTCEASRKQLPPGNSPMLQICEGANDRIRRPRSEFATHTVVNPAETRDAP